MVRLTFDHNKVVSEYDLNIKKIPDYIKYLQIIDHNLEYIDLSNLSKLENLSITSNNIKEIILPLNSSLKYLELSSRNDNILDIDFTNQLNLEILELYQIKLKYFPKNIKLKKLFIISETNYLEDIIFNENLEELGLWIYEKNLNNIINKINNMKYLKKLSLIYYFSLSSIQKEIKIILSSENIEELQINGFQYLKLDIIKLINIKILDLNDNNGYYIDISNNKKLQEIICDSFGILSKEKIIKRRRIYQLCESKVGQNLIQKKNLFENSFKQLRKCPRCKKNINKYDLYNIRYYFLHVKRSNDGYKISVLACC